MADEIRSTLEELKNIAQELYTLNKKVKELRERKKELESGVVEYLTEHNKPGLKIGGVVFLVGDKKTYARKKKAEVVADSLAVLAKHGLAENAEAVLEELAAVKKGDVSSSSVVKMKAAPIFS